MTGFGKGKRVVCRGCGTCCREPVVPVTKRDLERLCRFVKKEPREMVKFFSFSEMEYDPDAPIWVKLKYGRRVMALRKAKNRCIFLDSDNRCTVYRARPMTCRIFPYDIDIENCNELTGEGIKLHKIVKCKSLKGESSGFSDILRVASREMREDRQYNKIVRKWNRIRKKGTAYDFLLFLGLG